MPACAPRRWLTRSPGRTRHDRERGITAAECAADILSGLAVGKREFAVGRGPEMAALELVRANPELGFDMMAGLGEAIATGKM